MRLGCVIMASGEGKRFGSNKMLADIYGEPLIARTIDSVPRGFDVVVSTRWPEVAQICEDKHCPCVLHDGELRSRKRPVRAFRGEPNATGKVASFCRATSRL